MSVRFICLSAALWAAGCGISDSVDFGPNATPLATAGESAKGGATGTSGAGAGGKGGAATTGGKGGGPSGGAVSQPMAGTAGSSTAGKSPAGGAAGDAAGGAAGEPGTMPEPVCGNGIIEAGEECDASAASDHDGCDAQCRVVCAEHGDDVVESDDHHCYAGYRETEFEAARQDCESRGAHLATIGSAAENELITTEFIIESKYIGGFEDVALTAEGTGDYRWVTGEPMSFKNWADGEPDRAESRCGQSGPGPGPTAMRCYEHCIAILASGRWADQRCDRVDGWVCEWEPVGGK